VSFSFHSAYIGPAVSLPMFQLVLCQEFKKRQIAMSPQNVLSMQCVFCLCCNLDLEVVPEHHLYGEQQPPKQVHPKLWSEKVFIQHHNIFFKLAYLNEVMYYNRKLWIVSHLYFSFLFRISIP
jgi:hypothetical protein